MRWVCLQFPHLAMDALLRRLPDADAPHVLATGPLPRRMLHSLSPAAKALGLRRGMPLATAQLLAPELRVHAFDPAQEQAVRDLLAAWAYGFSSQVSLALPHAVVLEIGRSRALFGNWPELGRALASGLAEMGFVHRMVAAPNPHAAWVLARVHAELGVDEAHLERALGQVPLARSGLDADVVATLSRSGLRRLQQVFDLPRASLARRFAPGVLEHLDILRSGNAAPLPLFAPPDCFRSRMEFDQEVESSQALLFPLRRLTADLAAFLSSRDGGVQRFRLEFEHERLPPSALDVGLLSPERDAAMLFELSRSRLDHLRLPAAVRGLRLIARELPPFVPAARDLFDARPPQALPWEQLRERLRARLGDGAVRDVVLHADHRPEHATRSDGIAVRPPPALPRRPLWLLPQPIPLRGQVTVLEPPERLESGWWDGAEVHRDYAIVRTGQGQQAWAFRTPARPGQWFLHGWFA